MLSKYGNVKVASDSKCEAGTDFKFLDYNIECISCTSGDVQKNKLLDFRISKKRKSIIVDYNEKLKILLPRITKALFDKKDKIDEYISKRIIDSKEPCIIFISLGDISTDFFDGKYGFEFMRVLMGVGHQVLVYDRKTDKFCESYYSRNLSIMNHNNKPIDANFLMHSTNKNVSAVIFTSANMNELYTTENTFIFLNPFARNRIKVKDFWNFYYWKENKNKEYIPRYRGKNLWSDINKKYI